MGYMGLSHWVESDGAADFRYVLNELFKKHEGKKPLTSAVRKLILKEIKNDANCYNTSGPVNVALVMEDEGSEPNVELEDPGTPVFSKLLSKKEFQAIIKGLDKLIEKYGSEDVCDENTNMHREAFKRMKNSVVRKTYKENL